MSQSVLHPGDVRRPAYTIGTLVNDRAQWAAMRDSFVAHGFVEADCEFIAVHDPACGYRALNEILAQARGRHVILCHQDVRLIGDGRSELDRRLAELDTVAPDWAVAGNAGGVAPGALAIRITDPHGADRRLGSFPQRVMSLDENFLVVNGDVRIGFSRDLSGFHLYGADICLMAELAGCSAHVIDFHLQHLSPGRKDQSFARAADAFRRKWGRALRPRWLQTTCTLLRLDGGRATWAGRLAERGYAHLLRRRARRNMDAAAARGGPAPMSQSTIRRGRLLAIRVAGQGAMLFIGFGLAQLCSFARNAALAYWLSRGDFGLAAALAVTLQLVETISDIGADRLLVQAEDGKTPEMLAAAHTLLLARGILTAVVLLVAAAPMAAFFRVDDHVALFQALALVPFIRGFVNLEQRRRQRELDNSAYLATEVGS